MSEVGTRLWAPALSKLIASCDLIVAALARFSLTPPVKLSTFSMMKDSRPQGWSCESMATENVWVDGQDPQASCSVRMSAYLAFHHQLQLFAQYILHTHEVESLEIVVVENPFLVRRWMAQQPVQSGLHLAPLLAGVIVESVFWGIGILLTLLVQTGSKDVVLMVGIEFLDGRASPGQVR